jgi:hypothetical protein
MIWSLGLIFTSLITCSYVIFITPEKSTGGSSLKVSLKTIEK